MQDCMHTFIGCVPSLERRSPCPSQYPPLCSIRQTDGDYLRRRANDRRGLIIPSVIVLVRRFAARDRQCNPLSIEPGLLGQAPMMIISYAKTEERTIINPGKLQKSNDSSFGFISRSRAEVVIQWLSNREARALVLSRQSRMQTCFQRRDVIHRRSKGPALRWLTEGAVQRSASKVYIRVQSKLEFDHSPPL